MFSSDFVPTDPSQGPSIDLLSTSPKAPLGKAFHSQISLALIPTAQ